MKLSPPVSVTTEVLVIGGGGAGLRAAIQARERGTEVLLVSTSRAGYGNNTAKAGGVLAAATGWRDPRDNPEVHFRDTVLGGRYLNDQRLVQVMVEHAAQQVADLERFGVSLRRQEGRVWVTTAPGHSYPRHIIADRGIGAGLSLPMRSYALGSGVAFREDVLITRLLAKDNAVAGAVGLDERGNLFIFQAKSIILATGGLGQVFLRTNNAATATGDSYWLAYEAGLALKDMEFVQFHPTAIGGYGQRSLTYEAFVARAGATLKNSLGEDVLRRHGMDDPATVTRDMLARGIMLEVMEGRGVEGGVLMDISGVAEERLQRMLRLLPAPSRAKRTFTVAPTAHFFMGGINIDEGCQTDLEGLYAAGEACAGVHGANRLGGNAISEILVFGTIAGENAARRALSVKAPLPIDQAQLSLELERLSRLALARGGEHVSEIRQSLKHTMWYKAGVVRSEQSLGEAVKEIASLSERWGSVSVNTYHELSEALQLQAMLAVSEMICRAARRRTESRGAHYRIDYPDENNSDWLKNIVIRKQGDGMVLSVAPVAMWRMAPWEAGR